MSGAVLVTGASGLIGSELVPVLRAAGYEVLTTCRSGKGVDRRADLAVPAEAQALLAAARPDAVVHLAGGTDPDPDELYRGNVLSTVNVLAAASRLPTAPPCVVLGSAAEYGDGGPDAIAEDRRPRPLSDYGRAKAAQVILARQVAAARRLPLTVLRPFNVVSPRLPETTALGNIRRQLLAGTGARRPVACGRLDVVRDYVPVAVVVEAIRRSLARPQPGEVINVCSGTGLELRLVLAAMARRLGVTAVPSGSARLTGLPAADRVVGDPSRLRALLGLSPEASAEGIAATMLPAPEPSSG